VTASLAELRARAVSVRAQVERDSGEVRRIAMDGKRAEEETATLRGQVQLHELVTGVLTRLGEAQQVSAQQQIEALVTRGLQAVFDNSLSFHIVPGERAGQATTEFMIRSQSGSDSQDSQAGSVSTPGDNSVDTPVLEARGGGMVVVVAFMLRLVVLLLTPGARRVLFLDESFAHVSVGYRPRLAEFLREVTERAGVQIVMVTHDPEYAEYADKSYELSLVDGCTVVT
jgi:hypothetical protein